jgi:hypothetical protein
MKRTIRRQQTIDAAERLERAIRSWVGDWRLDDDDDTQGRTGRHHTHLNAIDSVLGGAAAALLQEARGLSVAVDAGLVYQQCREVDETVAWLYRLWQFYRLRLDQRRDPSPSVRDTVVACDEIVWSAYSQVMSAPAVRKAKIPHGPAPLPYVHDDYSPAAIDQSRPLPPALQMPLEFPAWDLQLKTIVDQLAAPLLETPRWCVGSPWWLIFVAHEVGHHLNGRLGLLEPTQQAIVDAVTPIAGDEVAQAWASWGEEVLADAWSTAFVGRAAAEALAEIELSEADAMRRQSSREYPPAALRLALMGRVAGALDLGAPILPAVCAAQALDADPDLAPYAGALDTVRDVLTGNLPRGLGTLASLSAVAASEFVKSVDGWSGRLRRDEAAAANTLPSARLLVAGCFQAWQSLRAEAEKPPGPVEPAVAVARFTKASADLARVATARLVKSGPPGTRAGTQSTGQAAGQAPGEDPASAAALAQRLLALARHGRGASAGGRGP